MSAVVPALVGAALGLSLAAPPGPMNAVIAEESVLRGWRGGFAAGLGAMTADASFFALAYLGVVAFVEHAPVLRAVMVGLGGVLMCYFAYGTARDASGGLPGVGAVRGDAAGLDGTSADESDLGSARRPDGGASGGEARGFRRAFALALTNPYQIVWWLTAGVGLLDGASATLFGHTVATAGGPVTVAGFFGGILVWIAGFPAALRAADRAVDRFGAAVAWLSALALACFGVYFLAQSAATLVA